jgi:hypothetical protein
LPSIPPNSLATIGFRVGGGRVLVPPEQFEVDIEKTLLDVILEVPSDRRLASVLFTWVKVHGNYVIVEKLRKLAGTKPWKGRPELVWLVAVARWAAECGGPKWKKLVTPTKEPVFLFDREVTESAIARKGAVPWLGEVGFRVPEGSLRIRESDVMSPEELASVNTQYRNRYRYGPSWRADIITAIESGLDSPAAIARRVGCSYEPAHRVLREWKVATAA